MLILDDFTITNLLYLIESVKVISHKFGLLRSFIHLCVSPANQIIQINLGDHNHLPISNNILRELLTCDRVLE